MEPIFSIVEGNNRYTDIDCSESKELQLAVYNDVDAYEAGMLAHKVVAILNDHWHDEKYDVMEPESFPEGLTEEESQAESDRRFEVGKKLLPDMPVRFLSK